MKRVIGALLVVGILVAGVVAAAEETKKAAKTTTARYLVMVPHTAEECLKALDEFEAAKALGAFEFACKTGDHTGYAMVMAKGTDDALAKVPENGRTNAKVVELHKFTAAELKSFHEQMDAKK